LYPLFNFRAQSYVFNSNRFLYCQYLSND